MGRILENEEGGLRESFYVTDKDGRPVLLHVLFTFDSEETGKSYVVYTDNSVDEMGSTQVFASTYDPEDRNTLLQPIETEKEWKVIEIVLEELKEG